MSRLPARRLAPGGVDPGHAGVTRHRVQWDVVAGRQVRTLRAGRAGPDRAPVVLVPGLGLTSYLIDTLHGCAAWTGAALLDVPGFGHHRPRPCAPLLSSAAALVAGWLRAAVDRPAVLFGHSTGAQVALQVACAVPDRVSALVLAGPTFPPALRAPGPVTRAFLRNLSHESPGLIADCLPDCVRGGPVPLLRYLRSAQCDRPEDLIASVGCPVTVVRGQRDVLCPAAWAGQLASAAPQGELVTAPGAHTFPFGRGGLTASVLARASMTSGRELHQERN